ncbi:Sulfite reductase [NADPH] hemoprotein beta-component [hydrothermal vent metagenome]|uniref:Sulfite reductase [NADPH] hemoprotein beta-component n=1 Tax=hydrothermal vent metagenome TaxID=652676 RepID=A0A3B0S550_9ZZZZ
MYSYDAFDRQLVHQRANQFQSQVARRISGALNEDEFRPLRLMNGLYLEMHAYMMRIAIPYGVLSARQMHVLGDIAEKYDRGYGHFTTRQNIQFNWLELDRVPEILVDLAKVDMHAIQSSGNCIRNVTADPYAGAAKDEIADPRPTAELVRQWSSLHPEFAFLPRKFKVAVTGSGNDRAAIRVHDIGIQLVEDQTGKPGYKIFVGGGLGRTPLVGVVLREFLPQDQLLAYLEATLRVYNLHGRRDNKYKARIKILTLELGLESLRKEVEAEFENTAAQAPATLPRLRKIERGFAIPAFESLVENSAALETMRLSDMVFSRWVETNVVAHKIPGYGIVNVSLKPIGDAPGDATAKQMHALADIAKRYSLNEIRVSKNQSLVLPHVKKDHLGDLWLELQNLGLAEANSGLITDIVSCPGMDYCSLATARSIPIAQQISNRFADPELQKTIGRISVKISGCINACGHHHIGQIGILGLEKNGEEYYQIVLGGDDSETAAIGKISGRGFSKDHIVDAIGRVIDKFLAQRAAGELFADTYRRLGATPFKEALYETD